MRARVVDPPAPARLLAVRAVQRRVTADCTVATRYLPTARARQQETSNLSNRPEKLIVTPFLDKTLSVGYNIPGTYSVALAAEYGFLIQFS